MLFPLLTIRAITFQVLRPNPKRLLGPAPVVQIGETRPGKSDVLDIFPFTWENQRPAYRERALSGMSWGTGIDICALPLHKADSWWELSSVLCDDLEG